MEYITIKDLQKNPAKLTKSIESKNLSLITKRSVPIGVVVPFDSDLILNDLKLNIIVKAYENGELSIGQIAKFLNKSKKETLKFLSNLGISVIDYDFNEDLENLSKL